MEQDRINELLAEIHKADFGMPFAMIPEDQKAALTKATSLGYLNIDPANNYCLSRIGKSIVDSGLSYREWETQNSRSDGTGLLDEPDEVLPASAETPEPVKGIEVEPDEEKPAKKSWLSIFGLK
jgi:hypothetical protein